METKRCVLPISTGWRPRVVDGFSVEYEIEQVLQYLGDRIETGRGEIGIRTPTHLLGLKIAEDGSRLEDEPSQFDCPARTREGNKSQNRWATTLL